MDDGEKVKHVISYRQVYGCEYQDGSVPWYFSAHWYPCHFATCDAYKHKAVSKGEICDSVIGKNVDRMMDGLSARMFLCIKPGFLSRLLTSTCKIPG